MNARPAVQATPAAFAGDESFLALARQGDPDHAGLRGVGRKANRR